MKKLLLLTTLAAMACSAPPPKPEKAPIILREDSLGKCREEVLELLTDAHNAWGLAVAGHCQQARELLETVNEMPQSCIDKKVDRPIVDSVTTINTLVGNAYRAIVECEKPDPT